MAKQKRPPAGNTARMIRPQPEHSRPGRRPHDPKDAYTAEQLIEIGAIALIWNSIDDFVDFLLHICLGSPIALLWAVGRSIGSLDAKLELLELGAARSHVLESTSDIGTGLFIPFRITQTLALRIQWIGERLCFKVW